MHLIINFNTLLIIKRNIYLWCKERKKNIQREHGVFTIDNESLINLMNEFTNRWAVYYHLVRIKILFIIHWYIGVSSFCTQNIIDKFRFYQICCMHYLRSIFVEFKKGLTIQNQIFTSTKYFVKYSFKKTDCNSCRR